MTRNKISHIGVKGIIANDEGKVLITQEPTHFVGGGKWELPGGKIAEGEEDVSLEEILRREIREELGESFQVEVGKVVDVMRRPWNKPGAVADQVMLAVFECRHISGDIHLSHENNNFAWITSSELSQQEFIPGYLLVLEHYFKQTHEKES
ncbi:MAG: NUDIX domain-containing protein [Patescibacteria group bacterium]